MPYKDSLSGEIDNCQKQKRQKYGQLDKGAPAVCLVVINSDGEEIEDKHVEGDKKEGIHIKADAKTSPGGAVRAHATFIGEA